MANIKNLFFALLLLPTMAPGQSLEQWEYLQATFISPNFNSEVRVVLDNGSRVLTNFKKLEYLKDSTGAELFKSEVAAMNFLGAQGWECFSHFEKKDTVLEQRTYVFKRRKR